ncbi:hypothetical protein J3Q64DRAFT_1001234 [Phycomyces blakesleeanus]|uniref:T. brucei spp.-specific protein n=1 Tax=Phycomyces blakesleeanus TaxID=4837 RepID=A0ABR3BAP3_PHYBL
MYTYTYTYTYTWCGKEKKCAESSSNFVCFCFCVCKGCPQNFAFIHPSLYFCIFFLIQINPIQSFLLLLLCVQFPSVVYTCVPITSIHLIIKCIYIYMCICVLQVRTTMVTMMIIRERERVGARIKVNLVIAEIKIN